jgi:serine/threonine protein kinase
MSETWEQWQGQVVNGEFRLIQCLGSSGQSGVFLTERGQEERQKAAIKLVPVDAAKAELQLSHWERAKNLSHPNLLRVFATGRCQLKAKSFLYVVMEYAEEDLSQILPFRPLSTGEAREMLVPVTSALEYLHGQALVHAHLKPSNVMAIGDQLKLSTDGVWAVGESSAK